MQTAAAVVLIVLALLFGGAILIASWRFVARMKYDNDPDEARRPPR